MEARDDSAGGAMKPGGFAARHSLLLLTLVLTGLRLLAAGAIHLTEDEAYYRLWAEHLQAGYLDHPPMIGWWVRLGMLVAGDTPLGVRLIPTLATGVTTWLVGDLARRLGASERTAWRAALWYNATFTVALGGMLATPDTPACLFWTLCLWCLTRTGEPRGGPWWLAAGAAAGLACLSKYSALFIAPGVLLWLAVTPGGLATLRKPWPWLAIVCAVVLFVPNVIWNATHEWLTFEKQFGRVAASGLRLGRLPEFLFTQFLLLNPLLAVQAGRGAVQAWTQRRTPGAPRLILPLAVATPFVLYLAVHSLHDRVQGHWPVPAFSALVICAAVAAETSRPWLRKATPILGLGLTAIVALHLAMPRSGYASVFDPTLSIRNWNTFARDVEGMRKANDAAWVGTRSYGVLSQLRAEGKITTPIVQIEERDRYFDWDRDADLSKPGLVLDLDRRIKLADLQRCFASVRPAGDLDRGPPPGPASHYTAFLVEGPKRDVLREGCPTD